MGITLIKILIAEYIVIGLVFLYQRNYPMTIYWIGATVLNIGVLLMGGK